MFSQQFPLLWCGFAAAFLIASPLHGQPDGVVSSVKTEGVIVTKRANPEHFYFDHGIREEHFDGTMETMQFEGGPTVGEPIVGLHYVVPKYVVNGSGWDPADEKLIADQFHAGRTGDFYFFRTIEGKLFYLPKEGQTAVVRIDYILKGGQTTTLWMLK